NPETNVTVFPPRPAVVRRISTRPRFRFGSLRREPTTGEACAPGAAVACGAGALGRPLPLRFPNGFCPSEAPPSVAIRPPFCSRPATAPSSADSGWDVRVAVEPHHRLRVTATLEEVHQLRMQ